MPTYDFRCLQCPKKNNKEFRFSIKQSIPDYTGEAECPVCKTVSSSRIYFGFAVHEGLTAAEKGAGTTKHRADLGKYMRSERTKRKENAEPGTKDAISNELWTGTEAKRGVISAPEK